VRLVVDTNVLVSRLLAPRSVPARAVRDAADNHRLLASAATLAELADVLARAKFDPYLSLADARVSSSVSGASRRS
jgi:predicted nucleic acid-binding protein